MGKCGPFRRNEMLGRAILQCVQQRTLRRVRPPNTHLVRAVSLSVVAVASAGLTLWMLIDDSRIDVGSAVGIVLSLAALVVAMLDFFRGADTSPLDAAALADDLALQLRAQWLDEAGARRLRDERVLPLTWTATRRRVTDPRWNRPEGSRVVRLHLDGRLDGRFEEVVGRLAEGYARVPHQRLVVVGEPGSGKTVLSMLLTSGLLAAREEGGPVPVLLPVASWDPVQEPLNDWVVRTMAQPYYNGREDIPRILLEQGLVIPVLDGLDEIPETARRGAIREINKTGTDRPLIVTCRAVEYEELVLNGAPALRQAAVVEVLPVRPGDVVTYLRGVEWPDGVDWEPVLAHLRTEPDSPLTTALSTPLLVTSARLVYQRGGNPGELLDTTRFGSTYAVEDHLLKGMVDAAYAPDPRLPEGAETGERWTAEQAGRWLTYLARHLHGLRERDLAWWLLSGRLLSKWAGPLTGLPLGVLLMAATMMFADLTGRSVALSDGFLIAFLYTLVHTAAWHASAFRTPSRLSWAVEGSGRRLFRGFRTGVATAALIVLPFMIPTTVEGTDFSKSGWTAEEMQAVLEGAGTSVALLVLAGLTFAVHGWLDAPPSSAAQASPQRLLAQDRWSAVVSAGAAGVLVILLGTAAVWAGELAGRLMFLALTGAGRADPALLVREGLLSVDFLDWVTGTGLLFGACLTVILLMSQAWPRFVLVRAWLALRGKLPWRLMAFLADARRREILRQVGGVYQFRHIRLQETLAGVPQYPDEASAARARVKRRAILAVGVGAATLGVVGGARRFQDGSSTKLALPGSPEVRAVRFRPPSETGATSVAYMLEDGTVGQWNGRASDRKPSTLLGPQRRVGLQTEESQSGGLLFLPGGATLVVPTAKGSTALGLNDGTNTFLPGNDMEDGGDMSTDFLACDANGHYLACSQVGGGVNIREMTSGKNGSPPSFKPPFAAGRLDNFPLGGLGLAFLKDGSLAMLVDGAVGRYRGPGFDKFEKLLPLPGDKDRTAFAVGGGGRLLAVGGSDGVEVWQWKGDGFDSSPWPLKGSTQTQSLAFDPSGFLLAVSGDESGDVKLHATEPARRDRRAARLRGHMTTVACLDFSHDGNWLVTGDTEGTIRIWDVKRYSV